jgi:hypothetical protein
MHSYLSALGYVALGYVVSSYLHSINTLRHFQTMSCPRIIGLEGLKCNSRMCLCHRIDAYILATSCILVKFTMETLLQYTLRSFREFEGSP